MTIPTYYYGRLAQIESSNNPNAVASSSSATGLYQFTKGTWEGLGMNWTDRFSVDLQNQAIEKLTQQNANVLMSNGATVDGGSLYGAHFLGAGTAAKIYTAPNDADISRYVSKQAIASNPSVFKNIKTVGDFKDWAASKIGVGQSSGNPYGSAIGDLSTGNIFGAIGDAIGGIVGGSLGSTIQGIFGGAAGKTDQGANSVENDVNDATAASAQKAKNLLDWIKAFFSTNTASRIVAVIVGFILIAGAIWALVNSDKVIEQVAQAA